LLSPFLAPGRVLVCCAKALAASNMSCRRARCAPAREKTPNKKGDRILKDLTPLSPFKFPYLFFPKIKKYGTYYIPFFPVCKVFFFTIFHFFNFLYLFTKAAKLYSKKTF